MARTNRRVAVKKDPRERVGARQERSRLQRLLDRYRTTGEAPEGVTQTSTAAAAPGPLSLSGTPIVQDPALTQPVMPLGDTSAVTTGVTTSTATPPVNPFDDGEYPDDHSDPGDPDYVPPPTPPTGGIDPNTQWPAELRNFLAELSRQAAQDTSGQGFNLADQIRQRLQGNVFQNYLDQFYMGDIMGVDMDLPEPNLGELLQAIRGDTVQGGPGGQPNSDGGPVSSDGVAGDSTTGGGTSTGASSPGVRTPLPLMGNRGAIGANAQWGQNYADQGYVRGGEGRTGRIYREGDIKKKWGQFANATWLYRDIGGQLYKKAKPGQEGRIAAGWGDWQPAEPHEQKSYQNPERRQYFAQNPEAGWDDWVMRQGLLKHIKGGAVHPDPTHPGWFVNDAGETWDQNGRRLNLSRSGFEGDEPDSPQYPQGGGDGTGGGTGGGVDSNSLSSFLSGIPGGGWSQKTAGAFNPNNSQSWSMLAAPAAGLAADLDAQRKMNRDSLTGGAREFADATATNSAFGGIANLRQGQVQNALGYAQGRANPNFTFNPMGSASSGASSAGSAYGSDQNYGLGQQQIAAQDRGNQQNFWGSVLGALGTFAGGAVRASDIAAKKDITPHLEGLEAVKALKTFDWVYNDRVKELAGKRSSGVMAQDLEKVLPEAVLMDLGTHLKMVDYGQVLATTINAVQEMDEKLERLKKLVRKK